MGKYTFSWEHPADEVYVTGTFDNWQKTVKLDKVDGVFRKTVELPKTKTQYKFVVNNNWCTNETAPGEDDGHNNYNNVLYPEDIKEEPVETLSSAAPQSSTAALASEVPKETPTPGLDDLPGSFPETPANDLKTFSVKPIPATAGAGNPVHLKPGEKVPDPSTLTSNTVSSTAKTDAASYERADAPPPQLGPVVITPEAEREANGGMFGLPPVSGSLIPESSLPKDALASTEKDPGVTTQSAAPTSSTAALAALVPKEPRGVPEVVKESQKEADASPEASANPDAVQEKSIIEKELKSKVSEEPPAAESPTATQKAAGSVADSTAGVAATFAGATYAAKDKAVEALGISRTAPSDHSSGVPDVVTRSQEEAHAAPEASANPEAVQEKGILEEELKSKVSEEPASAESPTTTQKAAGSLGDSAAGVAATFTGATYAAKDKAAAALGVDGNTSNDNTSDVPEVVTKSQEEAHVAPEASANPEAVEEKAAVESELLKEVAKTEETGQPAGFFSDLPAVVSQSQEKAHAAPEASANPEAVSEKAAVESELLKEVKKSDGADEPTHPAAAVPEVVADSQEHAHVAPEASANAEAVKGKSAVESELLHEVKKTDEAGEPAPTITAATIETAPGAPKEKSTNAEPATSSNEPVGPLGESGLNASAEKPAVPSTSKPNAESTETATAKPTTEQTQPTVTTGVESTKTTEHTTASPSTPKAARPSESATSTPENGTSTDKKKKRRSIFGKIKDKLLH